MQVLLIAKNVLISVLPVLYQIAIAHHAKDKIEYHLQLIIHACNYFDILYYLHHLRILLNK